MAIIHGIPGLEATIRVNGRTAAEYEDPNAEKAVVKRIPRVVKYIEAVSGAQFTMHFTKSENFSHKSHHIAVKYEADNIRTELSHEPNDVRHSLWEDAFFDLSYGNDAEGFKGHSLCFGDLNIDSNNRTSESIKSQIETAKNFGVLRIYVYYMKSSKARRAYIETYKNDVVDTIDEKALKGRSVTQNVRLSKLVPTERPESSQKDLYYDRSRRHFAIFEFRYRSKDGLIEEGIIPRPNPIDEMNDEEARAYARRMWEDAQKNVLSVKQEPSGHGPELDNFYARKRSVSTNEHRPAKRYKENIRQDGKVEIKLDDDDD